MIRVNNLTKKFKDNTIIENISITFKPGNIYGLYGRNGSGKSVFLKLLCGLINTTSGEIYYNDELLKNDIYKYSVGALIERPYFLDDLTGFENLKILADINKKIDDDDILKALEIVNLLEEKDKKYKKYSLGMCQKLGIAQAIMENPNIIILDECFNGIENATVEKIKKYLISEKKKGKIIIISSHIKEDLLDLTNTIYYFDAGKIENSDEK